MFGFVSTLLGDAWSPRRRSRRRLSRMRRRPACRQFLQVVDLEERVVPTSSAAISPAAVGLLVPGLAPETMAPAAMPAGQSDGQDQVPLVSKSMDGPFLYYAARGNEQEIILGALATQVASFKGVKHFGRRLAGDHALGLAQIVPVLADAGLPLPGLKADQRDVVAGFSFLAGADFDRAFADFMVEDHEEDIAVFQDEIQNGQNPEAVAYAQQNLPVLMKHLRIAEKLQQELGEGDRGTGKPRRLPAASPTGSSSCMPPGEISRRSSWARWPLSSAPIAGWWRSATGSWPTMPAH